MNNVKTDTNILLISEFAIVLENYFSSVKEKGWGFTLNVVIPAIKEIKKITGVSPLIVPLVPLEDESDLYWYCYPEHIKNIIAREIL